LNGDSEDEAVGQLLRDVLWSDPTPSDRVLGIHGRSVTWLPKPNPLSASLDMYERVCGCGVCCSPRGARIATFGPDVVHEFCRRNDIDVIIRSHEVVDAGYEFFCNKQLITVFSATGYCRQNQNDGAILEIDRDLVIHPKIGT
jgi:diadenosine tetraphosphatase ApaH/serine/threonine PP2A family protein phosphatase